MLLCYRLQQHGRGGAWVMSRTPYRLRVFSRQQSIRLSTEILTFFDLVLSGVPASYMQLHLPAEQRTEAEQSSTSGLERQESACALDTRIQHMDPDVEGLAPAQTRPHAHAPAVSGQRWLFHLIVYRGEVLPASTNHASPVL